MIVKIAPMMNGANDNDLSTKSLCRACDKCKNDKRKTINGDDLLFALYQLGFERYLDNLNLYYQKYKEVSGCINLYTCLGIEIKRQDRSIV